MSRDPERIIRMQIKLGNLWRQSPDLRLGQLMMILAGNQDLFYIEDDVMLAWIEQLTIKWTKAKEKPTPEDND